MQNRSPKAHRRAWLRILLAAAVIALTAAPGIAYAEPSAEDISTGRKLAKEAYTAFKSKDFDTAVAKFKQASDLYPSGQVLRYRGYSLLALKRWDEAVGVLEQALETTIKPLSPVEAEDTEDKIKEAKTHIAIVHIRSNVRGATARLDDGEAKKLPHRFLVKPGDIELVIEAKGYETRSESREVKAGSEQKIGFDLKKASDKATKQSKPKPKAKPKPKPKPSKPINLFAGWFPHQGTIGLVTAGLGVAVGSFALATGLHGLSVRGAVQENIDAHNSNYDAACSQNTQLCQYDIALINSDGERAQLYQNMGLITGIVGASLVAVGATFWIFAPDGPIGNSAKDHDGKDKATLGCLPTASFGASGSGISTSRGPLGSSLLGVACGGRF